MFWVVLAKHGRDATARDGFVAASTKRASLGVIMSLTVWLSLVVIKRAALERLQAIPTDKALGMPLHAQRRNVVLCDGHTTARALWSKHSEVVLSAIRFAVLLVEAFLTELTAALCAKEVFWMPGTVEGRHALIQNWPIAVTATW